ncbi:transcriptional regulator GutM [Staphylococcus gallinarum]|uniref:transcriptional regulator GutM n=1 Tax=Staphylococcus TaxID=1279 RepID=UPI000D1EEDCE|nr:transcriptional regulator GutM [Staphylococcus gallinarum]MCD8820654.1 transcriptional regulator GutM [Staphylococcus gallinarum]MCD8871561.1 transcriptional regulator GutM [Staphylococcus gallinarum]MCW0986205.1 transcriptional regulator GutM [Staphylococcus gallinarum]MEB6242657.1 transcriptional regulator GutM [Staphylococcus gallinarum]MEB6295837.1 transcriptional regulator GutM [Staphylococcus gallinarum]
MFILLLIILAAAGFVIQHLLGWLQIKNFTKHYIELRRKGKVAIGRRPAIFKSGTLVLLQLNGKNEIEEARFMQGVTVFSKFKPLAGLKGLKINKITDQEISNYNKLLIKAILDAQHTFNVVSNGGEIEKIPSPMMKAVKKVNKLIRNERGLKNGLHR